MQNASLVALPFILPTGKRTTKTKSRATVLEARKTFIDVQPVSTGVAEASAFKLTYKDQSMLASKTDMVSLSMRGLSVLRKHIPVFLSEKKNKDMSFWFVNFAYI